MCLDDTPVEVYSGSGRPLMGNANKNPRVSVIIPNWNGRTLLSTCLRSLSNQTCKDFEIIVVDNGSSDGSVEFVESNYPEARVIAFSDNRGFCKAVNEGIKASEGEYVVLLNNDTEVENSWLHELVRALDENPDIGFCASKMLNYYKRDQIDSVGDEVLKSGFARKIGFKEEDRGQFDGERRIFSASGAAAMYRRSMLDDIGLFDEDFFAYFEDIDLGLRAQLRGYQCLYVPTAVVYHIEEATAKRYPEIRVSLGFRNAVILSIKNIPFSLLMKNLFFILFAHFRAIIFLTLKGHSKGVIKSEGYLLRNFHKILRRRKEIQKRRVVSDEYIGSLVKRERFSLKTFKGWVNAIFEK